MLRYLIPAVLVVAGIVGGLLWLPERLGEETVVVSESGTKVQGGFVDLPPPNEPDYTTVVTDEALAEELAEEANTYLEELSSPVAEAIAAAGGEVPLLQTLDGQLSWAGQDESVGELLVRYGITPQADALFYAHRVTEADSQGVWGVIQSALITRFADGVAVRRGDNQKTYRLLIPQHADERNADGTSSFLGRVIWHKTQQSQVINTARGWARQSVDVIVPDQDMVIVGFDREQLVAIYQYFATAAR